MKKRLPIIGAAVVVLVAVLYFVVLRPGGDASTKKVVYSQYSPGDFFVTNVTGSSHLFKTAIVLVIDSDDKKLAEDLKAQNAEIRDAIIFILRSKSLDEINDVSRTDGLRQEIIDALNAALGSEHIVGVLFNDYVVQ